MTHPLDEVLELFRPALVDHDATERALIELERSDSEKPVAAAVAALMLPNVVVTPSTESVLYAALVVLQEQCREVKQLQRSNEQLTSELDAVRTSPNVVEENWAEALEAAFKAANAGDVEQAQALVRVADAYGRRIDTAAWRERFAARREARS